MPDAVDSQQQEYLGTGWAFPIPLSEQEKIQLSTKQEHRESILTVQGGIRLSSQAQKVKESIRIILATGVGERVYRPDFGSRLAELAFAPMNSETLMQIRLYVLEALETWEPRIIIQQIIIEPYSKKGEEGRLDIIINYRLKDQPDIHSFVYPYYLASAVE